jgi:hypothetical protein
MLPRSMFHPQIMTGSRSQVPSPESLVREPIWNEVVTKGKSSEGLTRANTVMNCFVISPADEDKADEGAWPNRNRQGTLQMTRK